METREYVTRLEELAQDVRRVYSKAQELFSQAPTSELEGGTYSDLLEEIREISGMLRADLESTLERANRVAQLAKMIQVTGNNLARRNN